MASFELSYASTPLCASTPEIEQWIAENVCQYPDSIANRPEWPGKNLTGLAFAEGREQDVTPSIGEYYYPTGASRWSRFRGIVAEAQKDAMVKATLTSGSTPKPFVIKTTPERPDEVQGNVYTFQTNLYLLPPRPLADNYSPNQDHEPLWLIELVDERYYWQYRNGDVIHPTYESTWSEIIDQLADLLGIQIEYDVPAVYLQPEPDSPLWNNYENIALLLDAVAWNLGRTVIRNLDGTYRLQNNSTAAAQALDNRKIPVRIAGGDLLETDTRAVNAVLPQTVLVSFPTYILNDVTEEDGAPHFFNSRYRTDPRVTAWSEESYGDVFWISISLSEVGNPWSNFTGHPGQKTIHDTAKALYHQEADAEENADPINFDQLQALALQLAKDFYSNQAASVDGIFVAYDEVYPASLKWTPEGIHDLLWTYSATECKTRAFRSPWNWQVEEMQHSTGGVEGSGGHTVAQRWQSAEGGSGPVVSGPFDYINLVTFDSRDFRLESGVENNGINEVRVFLNDAEEEGCCCPNPSSVTFTGPAYYLPAKGPSYSLIYSGPTEAVVWVPPFDELGSGPSGPCCVTSGPSGPCWEADILNGTANQFMRLIPRSGPPVPGSGPESGPWSGPPSPIDGSLSGVPVPPGASVRLLPAKDGSGFNVFPGRFLEPARDLSGPVYTFQPGDHSKVLEYQGSGPLDMVYPGPPFDGWATDLVNRSVTRSAMNVISSDGTPTRAVTYGRSARLTGRTGVNHPSFLPGEPTVFCRHYDSNFTVEEDVSGSVLNLDTESGQILTVTFISTILPEYFHVWVQNTGTGTAKLTSVNRFDGSNDDIELAPRQGIFIQGGADNDFCTERGKSPSDAREVDDPAYQLKETDWGQELHGIGDTDLFWVLPDQMTLGWPVTVGNRTNGKKLVIVNEDGTVFRKLPVGHSINIVRGEDKYLGYSGAWAYPVYTHTTSADIPFAKCFSQHTFRFDNPTGGNATLQPDTLDAALEVTISNHALSLGDVNIIVPSPGMETFTHLIYLAPGDSITIRCKNPTDGYYAERGVVGFPAFEIDTPSYALKHTDNHRTLYFTADNNLIQVTADSTFHQGFTCTLVASNTVDGYVYFQPTIGLPQYIPWHESITITVMEDGSFHAEGGLTLAGLITETESTTIEINRTNRHTDFNVPGTGGYATAVLGSTTDNEHFSTDFSNNYASEVNLLVDAPGGSWVGGFQPFLVPGASCRVSSDGQGNYAAQPGFYFAPVNYQTGDYMIIGKDHKGTIECVGDTDQIITFDPLMPGGLQFRVNNRTSGAYKTVYLLDNIDLVYRITSDCGVEVEWDGSGHFVIVAGQMRHPGTLSLTGNTLNFGNSHESSWLYSLSASDSVDLHEDTIVNGYTVEIGVDPDSPDPDAVLVVNTLVPLFGLPGNTLANCQGGTISCHGDYYVFIPTGVCGGNGPSGPSGPSGPAGAAGGSGPSGPTGASGPSGPSGASISVPSGTIIAFGGTSAPTGYLSCDGSAVSRTTYSDLFTAIGTTWGVGDGSTTFNVPNLDRRTLVGSGGSGTGTLGNAVGNTGGAETHTLDTTQIPSHSHWTGRNDLTSAAGASYGILGQQVSYVASSNTGGGGAHNNMQPSAVVKYCIKT